MPHLHRALSTLWAFRATAEREAEARFRRLASRLAKIAASTEVLALANRAVEDEVRHQSLCAEMASRYGDAAIEPGAAVLPEVAPARFSLPERVLYEVVGFCCIVETLNASLMTATLELSRDGETRAAVHEILRDEVGHSRLGWAHLAWARQRGEGAFLAAALPRMLEGAAKEELFLPDDVEPDPERALELGNLPRSVRLAVFRDGLESVIFPGFEVHGVDTSAARTWLRELCSRPIVSA